MGIVVLYGGEADPMHERSTREKIGREMAALKGYEFDGFFTPTKQYDGHVYFVPAQTVDLATARSIGIQSHDDIFGGVTPQPFVATKVITHPLVTEGADAPSDWATAFPEIVHGVVLDGYSVFSARDARLAGERLLDRGPVRAKLPSGVAGRGQHVCRTMNDLDAVIAKLDRELLATSGLVLEENLADVETFSVGQVHVGDLVVSYVGTQRLTRANDGHTVYGGSTLLLARGDFEALLALELPDAERDAIAKARVYDGAADTAFPGFIASRRNYDVARGHDGKGRERCGVLEQSWRMGGASGIEMAALVAFHEDPQVVTVRASSYEVYGDGANVPPHANVYFQGDDNEVGRLVKYTVVDEHVGR